MANIGVLAKSGANWVVKMKDGERSFSITSSLSQTSFITSGHAPGYWFAKKVVYAGREFEIDKTIKTPGTKNDLLGKICFTLKDSREFYPHFRLSAREGFLLEFMLLTLFVP